MKNIAAHIAAAVLAMAASSQASADAVTFTGFAHGSESVNYTLNGSGPAAVSAGGFTTILNGGSSFTSYCVDLAQSISFGTTYTDYFPVGGAHVFANSHAYADLSRLYAVAGQAGDSAHAAAFQIAAWEIAYETAATYALGSGAATFSGGSADTSGALGLASGWLMALGNAGPGPGIGVLDSAGHQDVIYAPVPEPSSIMLMVAGLAAMGTIARRRRTAADKAAA